ncbi:unnamed protein product [Triticum turgidum subsp. durum]|uniref:F-box associated beta-propeller type 3 domain-containing protein n=1 Tax=Triticum turgidum subsp. durum TaxID=4567 RepID=A0A9R1QYX2_TRITD|nr:unnamed protein product [Triticum turgidum subsp. durum]
MEPVAADEILLRKILLGLPTRAVARGRCVSTQWRGLLSDPAFLDLHAHSAHVVSGARAAAEALLVSRTEPEPGLVPKTTVYNVCTAATMCVLNLLAGYTPAQACNGFVLFVANNATWLPLVICNPITGVKLAVDPPLRSETSSVFWNSHWHMDAMGYSPSTREYKLFRLSFSASGDQGLLDVNYLQVFTLGRGPGAGVWRRRQGLFTCHAMGSPPALIDGTLYFLAKQQDRDRKPDSLMIIDVATETCRTCRLPIYYTDEAVAHVLELQGRPSVAMHELSPTNRLRFFVLAAAPPSLCWQLRYIFEMGATHLVHQPRQYPYLRAAWFDANANSDDNADTNGGILYYLYGDCVYKYDTSQDQPCFDKVWDDQKQLHSSDINRSVLPGYRPNLLSPDDLAITPRQAIEEFAVMLVGALRALKKRRRSPSPPATV